ncbi:MAG: aldehyde dehydrogenase family protein, partial [Eubacterium sp.]|nr:aldehyde dehydrogenase family protein [Candidatus Colimonas fimequi]
MLEVKNYINGEWVMATAGNVTSIINPATKEVIAKAAASGLPDVEKAVEAANNSFYKTREWRDMSAADRAAVLNKIADKIEERVDEIAMCSTVNQGKPLKEAELDIYDSANVFRYYAGLITKPEGGNIPTNDGFGKVHVTEQMEPIGVCALISPWNFPLLMAAWKVAPALAAGNSIILKPPTITPLSSVKLFEILDECDLPKGTANLLLGPGGLIGDALAAHKKIDMLSFTGSTVVGQSIMRQAANNVKKLDLELGGKSPIVIFDDTDIDRAVEWTMLGIFFNQGEICCATSRAIVQDTIYDVFLGKLAARANAITIGNPVNNPDMGAIVSESQYNTVLDYIEIGKKEGARLVCGGESYTEGECANGYFIKPTIFADCTQDMRIVQEEIFGPVLCVSKFSTEEEAVDLANDTDFGLAGAVFTNNVYRAKRVIDELRAGICWINGSQPAYCEAPWGGYKMSG